MLALQESLHARDEFGSFFIVRACFPKLFAAIVAQLKTRLTVSVVSTAGTGKSTFLFYFATRYVRLHRNQRVLVRVPKDDSSFLFSSRATPTGVEVSVLASTFQRFERERGDNSVLQLIDGCNGITVLPPAGLRAVGFFSPRTYTKDHGEWQKVSFDL